MLKKKSSILHGKSKTESRSPSGRARRQKTWKSRKTPQQNTGGTEQASGSGKVNLNTAGKEELMTLSGIGESRADAIIAYREANGPFGSIEEIMNIEGIKGKMFEKIRGSIEV